MQAFILAGGQGTRMGVMTLQKPKPMIEIGGKPILWHIMQIFAAYGVREFAVATGVKGASIKQYFTTIRLYDPTITLDLRSGTIRSRQPCSGLAGSSGRYRRGYRNGWTVKTITAGHE